MTYVTITIVGIFFFLNLPRVFMGGYEVGKMHLVLHCAEYKEDYHPQMWYYKVDNICRFLMVLNSSINFLIYCIGNEQFKVWSQQCYQLFPKHLKILVGNTERQFLKEFWLLWEAPISLQFSNEFLCIFRRSFAIFLEIGVVKGYVQKEILLNLPLWLLMKLKAMEQKCWLWKCRNVQEVSLYSLYCFVMNESGIIVQFVILFLILFPEGAEEIRHPVADGLVPIMDNECTPV